VLLARFSGVAFRSRLIRKHLVSPEILSKINQHQQYGTVTMWVTLGLAAVALTSLWALPWRSHATPADGAAVGRRTGGPAVHVILAVVVVVLAGAALYYVYRTGDSAAHIVWGGF
jgi:hypothetical protein